MLPHLAAVKLQNFFGVFLQFQIGVDTHSSEGLLFYGNIILPFAIVLIG